MTGEIIRAFTEDQASRLTGVPVGRLRAWHKTRFYSPSIAYMQGVGRTYSFRDLLNLKIVWALRRDLGISMQHLREVGKKLSGIEDADWSVTTLYVLNRRVVFDNPHTKTREEIVSGQAIFDIPLQVVKSNMQEAIAVEFARRPETIGNIETKRRVVGSKPVVAGTRVPVSTIEAYLAEGFDTATIIDEFPSITEADVAAVKANLEAA